MDRKQQPDITNNFQFKLMDYNRHEFENGCVLLNFPYPILPVAKIDFIFPAGKKYQTAPLVASYANKMLMEGTSSLNQQQIAGGFEIQGASVNTFIQDDYAFVTTYCTKNNAESVLDLLYQILKDSVFPEEQIQILTQNDKQEYLVNMKKVSFLARRAFVKSLFPASYPYAVFAEETDYDSINRNHIIDFHKTNYSFSNCIIVWTGEIEPSSFQLLESLFGKGKKEVAGISEPVMTFTPPSPHRCDIEVADALQSAVYAGCHLPDPMHEDYHNLNILNTVLGGYFGSRLMKSIREEKGYTYGVGSGIVSNKHASYLLIGTQVKAQYTEDTVNEINNQIIRLQTEFIPQEELELVKNYLTGNLLQGLDGPFAQSKFFISAHKHNIDAQVLLEKISLSIRHITPNIIIQLANKYLKTEQLFYSVSGQIKNKEQ
jgi:zinc protease